MTDGKPFRKEYDYVYECRAEAMRTPNTPLGCQLMARTLYGGACPSRLSKVGSAYNPLHQRLVSPHFRCNHDALSAMAQYLYSRHYHYSLPHLKCISSGFLQPFATMYAHATTTTFRYDLGLDKKLKYSLQNPTDLWFRGARAGSRQHYSVTSSFGRPNESLPSSCWQGGLGFLDG